MHAYAFLVHMQLHFSSCTRWQAMQTTHMPNCIQLGVNGLQHTQYCCWKYTCLDDCQTMQKLKFDGIMPTQKCPGRHW